MKTQFYLIVNEEGGVRVSKIKPESVKSTEVSVFWTLDMPDHLFQKPLLRADVEIEATEVVPTKIKLKVDAIGDWLKTPAEDE